MRDLARYGFALFNDSGLVRLPIGNNTHRVASGVLRSGQPLPGDLDRLAHRHGLRTVLSLRWPKWNSPPLTLEREACERLGITFKRVKFRADKAPKIHHLHALVAAFEDLEYPVLIHCKSGIDRTGLAATLYLHLVEGYPIEAANQLRFWPFLYLPNGASGILQHFVHVYAAHPLAREHRFLEWVDTVYDRQALRAGFQPSSLPAVLAARWRARRTAPK